LAKDWSYSSHTIAYDIDCIPKETDTLPEICHRISRAGNSRVFYFWPAICIMLLAAMFSFGQKNKTATSTTLVSNMNSAPFGQLITFTASVSTKQQKPTGTVTFKDGNVTLGAGNLNAAGEANFSTPLLLAGTHFITAEFGGDASFSASKSAVLRQIMNRAPTLTKLSSSASSVTLGQQVSLNASVFTKNPAPTAGPLTGTVTFTDGTKAVGSEKLDMFQQSAFHFTALSAGSHSIIVSYGGDANFAPSKSAVFNLTVIK
jgi:hypothetical protein